MATFRVTWNFREIQGSSFNEVYYVDATNAAAATTAIPTLLSSRLALLYPGHTLRAIRAAQVDANRVTSTKPINLKGTAKALTVQVDPSIAGAAAVISLAGATGGSRKLWMRGLFDDFINIDSATGADAPLAGFIDALQTWFKALALANYGVRQVAGQSIGPLTNLKILRVDGTAGVGTSVITCAGPPLYAPGARVIIGGASKKDLPALNGRWQLIGGITANTFVIPYQTPQGLLVNGGNAKVRLEQYNAVVPFLAANCGFSYFTTRSTKNPTTGSRGARRAVRIRTSL